MQKETKLISTIGVLTALTGIAVLWIFDAETGLPSIGLLAAVGLGAAAVTGIARVWLRNRHRRHIMGMRDSALW
jgi:hypothetical protein